MTTFIMHLFCQGTEITLKALLLFADFHKYKPRLQNEYGHKLEKLATEVSEVFCLHQLRPKLREELRSLGFYFAKHLLRYATLARRTFLRTRTPSSGTQCSVEWSPCCGWSKESLGVNPADAPNEI